jgi:hypothetical protein
MFWRVGFNWPGETCPSRRTELTLKVLVCRSVWTLHKTVDPCVQISLKATENCRSMCTDQCEHYRKLSVHVCRSVWTLQKTVDPCVQISVKATENCRSMCADQWEHYARNFPGEYRAAGEQGWQLWHQLSTNCLGNVVSSTSHNPIGFHGLLRRKALLYFYIGVYSENMRKPRQILVRKAGLPVESTSSECRSSALDLQQPFQLFRPLTGHLEVTEK